MTQAIDVRREPEGVATSIAQLEDSFALAVRQRELLEQYIRDRLKPGKHFYTVSEGQKPSLTKEGAELVCLPHGYKPAYDILSGPKEPPDDDKPYQIVAKCTLRKGERFEGEGIGSASSYVTKKGGTRQPRQKDSGLCHNATLKMAQKSAYIGATLNATAASEFFTQDLEDDDTPPGGKETATDPYCTEHKEHWFRRGKMKNFAHPIAGTDKWCNMPQAEPAPAPEMPKKATQQGTSATKGPKDGVLPQEGPKPTRDEILRDITDWKAELNWPYPTMVEWVKARLPGLGWLITERGLDIGKMQDSQLEALHAALYTACQEKAAKELENA